MRENRSIYKKNCELDRKNAEKCRLFQQIISTSVIFLQNSQTVEPLAYKWVAGDLTITLVKREVFDFVLHLL